MSLHGGGDASPKGLSKEAGSATQRTGVKRDRLPDPKYNDVLVQRFVNSVMWDGKKSTGEDDSCTGPST